MRSVCETSLAREDLTLNGECYVSLAFRPLLEQGRDVRVFPMRQFCQWGTPEDLADWQTWASAARLGAEGQKQPALPGTTLLPLAGLGRRFADAGYTTPKPLVPVNGQPMVLSARADLPRSANTIYALRRDMPESAELAARLSAQPDSHCVLLDGPTDGQARTCLIALEKTPGIALDAPLTIGACDNGLRYNAAAFADLWEQEKPDVLIWTVRGHAGARRHPEQYGWVDVDAQGRVRHVSVKRASADPTHDPVVTGAFTFRRAGDFRRAAVRMIERRGLVNGEYYVDECINDAIGLGLRVLAFDVDAYLCWGTPDDLKTWEYWQEFFA
ncbi:MAG: NTP transferase domain-containing protein [Desulfovibrionaceae bacterium]|nr:NTP transferase domain-containing protein [Desulfovibrionaceae bacterium]